MSEYTAEEYREALMSIYDMDAEERKKAFGVSTLVGGYVKDFSVSELLEKYNTYKNTPKDGEYWKSKDNGELVVVRYIKNGTVFIYYCDGGFSNQHSLKFFASHFTRTERKSQYLESFIKEMKEMSK